MQVLFFAGLLINEAINWVMKHSIKEFRPLRSLWLSVHYLLIMQLSSIGHITGLARLSLCHPPVHPSVLSGLSTWRLQVEGVYKPKLGHIHKHTG